MRPKDILARPPDDVETFYWEGLKSDGYRALVGISPLLISYEKEPLGELDLIVSLR